jgi:uncharacterized protein YecT (DUF1311 family)
MINKSVFFLLLLVIFCLPEFTYSSPIEECHKEFNSKKEVSKCMDLKLKKAEKSLEKKVSEIRQKMEQKSIKSNQIYPIRSFNLSQQSYLIYRKTNCNWYFDKSFPDTGSSELLKNCLIKMTLDRILELESSVDSPSISSDKDDDNKTQKVNKNNKENKEVKNVKEFDNTGDVKEENDNRQTRKTNENLGEDNYDDRAVYDIELDDRCYMKPDPGTCEEFIMKYFYYPDSGNCSSFIWTGCGGVVPFETMAECREICQ